MQGIKVEIWLWGEDRGEWLLDKNGGLEEVLNYVLFYF